MAITFGNEYAIVANTELINPVGANLDATHFVVAYGSGRNLYCKIATVSNGNQISYGTAYALPTIDSVNTYSQITILDSTHFAFTYDISNLPYVIIGTVSGNTISYGSEYPVSGTNRYLQRGMSSLDSTHFVIGTRNFGTGVGSAIIGTVSSGNVISYGSEYTFHNAALGQCCNTTKIDSTHFVVGYGNDSNSGYATIGTYSGGTLSFGIEYQFFTGGTVNSVSLSLLDSTHFVIAWGINGTGSTKVGAIASVNQITYGGQVDVSSSNGNYISVVTLDSTHFAVSTETASSSFIGKTQIGTVSSSTISLATAVTFNNASTSIVSSSDLDSTHIVVLFNDTADSNYSKGIIGTNPLPGSANVAIINGVPIANVKTICGVDIANVKTWNGVV